MNKHITLVAAMGRNRGIGLDGCMPWQLPADLRHFKATTMGKPVVMGRKTWESIGKALPGRQNLVVSRNPAYQAEGCQVVSSLVEAIEAADGFEVMVIGGGELYQQAFPLASRLVLTMVDVEPTADTWFPEWRPTDWLLVSSERYGSDERHAYGFEINQWMRKGEDST